MKFTRKSLTITGVCVGVGGLFLVILMWWYCKRKEQWELDFDEMFGDTGKLHLSADRSFFHGARGNKNTKKESILRY